MTAAPVIAAVALLWAGAAPAAEPAACVGEIARVVDGDTFDVACAGGSTLRLRLRDVDAPEVTGPCAAHGRAVRALVEAHFGPGEAHSGVIVSVRAAYADRWGRAVGDAAILEGAWLGWPLTGAVRALGEEAGLETLRPWPHDGAGREIARGARPVWCGARE